MISSFDGPLSAVWDSVKLDRVTIVASWPELGIQTVSGLHPKATEHYINVTMLWRVSKVFGSIRLAG
jgi:hypothetical protein